MIKTRLEKIFLWLGWVLTAISVFLLYRQGVNRSFFHQDDVVELGVVANWKFPNSLFHLNNEHLNITFWPLLRLQWLLFGTNYGPYLSLNIVMHLVVLAMIFIITYKLTRSFLWSSLPVWGMVINPNWFTVVWWITGQMFFLATIFALLTYWVILKIVDEPKKNFNYCWLYLFATLPGLSWGVGLTWPIWPLLVFGIEYNHKKINKIGYTLLAAQASLTGIYFSVIGNNLSIHTDPRTWLTKPFAILNFMVVGVSNTIVGRWLWPPENLRVRVLFLFVLLMSAGVVFKYRNKINRQVIFGLIVVLGSYLTFAIPRWRFGIGHAMANYYAYFPLPFLLISLSAFWNMISSKQVTKLVIMAIFIVHIPLSWIGFEEWARDWVVRPQQTRVYFQSLESTRQGECLENIYIPEYIVPQNIWRIDYLWPIFKKDFSPFCQNIK